MQKIREIKKCDLTAINEAYTSGLLRAKPFSWYNQFSRNTLDYFMWYNGIYVLPTVELIQALRELIIHSAIEICAGHGTLGRELNIPRTDSHLQSDDLMRMVYAANGQPPILYPNDVERLNATLAIQKYEPTTVIGGFVTHKWAEGMAEGNAFGVDEHWVLKQVKRYIMVGNLLTHAQKPLLKVPHNQITLPQLITRSADQSMNRIFVWTKA